MEWRVTGYRYFFLSLLAPFVAWKLWHFGTIRCRWTVDNKHSEQESASSPYGWWIFNCYCFILPPAHIHSCELWFFVLLSQTQTLYRTSVYDVDGKHSIFGLFFACAKFEFNRNGYRRSRLCVSNLPKNRSITNRQAALVRTTLRHVDVDEASIPVVAYILLRHSVFSLSVTLFLGLVTRSLMVLWIMQHVEVS